VVGRVCSVASLQWVCHDVSRVQRGVLAEVALCKQFLV